MTDRPEPARVEEIRRKWANPVRRSQRMVGDCEEIDFLLARVRELEGERDAFRVDFNTVQAALADTQAKLAQAEQRLKEEMAWHAAAVEGQQQAEQRVAGLERDLDRALWLAGVPEHMQDDDWSREYLDICERNPYPATPSPSGAPGGPA